MGFRTFQLERIYDFDLEVDLNFFVKNIRTKRIKTLRDLWLTAVYYNSLHSTIFFLQQPKYSTDDIHKKLVDRIHKSYYGEIFEQKALSQAREQVIKIGDLKKVSKKHLHQNHNLESILFPKYKNGLDLFGVANTGFKDPTDLLTKVEQKLEDQGQLDLLDINNMDWLESLIENIKSTDIRIVL